MGALSDRSQLAFHVEDVGDGYFEDRGDLESEEGRGIRLSAFDAHDRLAAHARTERQFLLCHMPLKPKPADMVAKDDVRFHRGGGDWHAARPAHCTDLDRRCKGWPDVGSFLRSRMVF